MAALIDFLSEFVGGHRALVCHSSQATSGLVGPGLSSRQRRGLRVACSLASTP
jgi:hypothetical protein